MSEYGGDCCSVGALTLKVSKQIAKQKAGKWATRLRYDMTFSPQCFSSSNVIYASAGQARPRPKLQALDINGTFT